MTRYHNKTTKALQIVFSVLCFIVAAFLVYCLAQMIISITASNGIAIAILLIVALVGGGIALGILLIPWILLLVFCKKPWLSLAAYLSVVVLFIACILTCVIGG